MERWKAPQGLVQTFRRPFRADCVHLSIHVTGVRVTLTLLGLHPHARLPHGIADEHDADASIAFEPLLDADPYVGNADDCDQGVGHLEQPS